VIPKNSGGCEDVVEAVEVGAGGSLPTSRFSFFSFLAFSFLPPRGRFFWLL